MVDPLACTEVIFGSGDTYRTGAAAVRSAVNLLTGAGVDAGVMGRDEACCGGRAYEIGYEGELTKYAEHNMEMLKTAGVKTLVSSCSDCYHSFKVLYQKIGQ